MRDVCRMSFNVLSQSNRNTWVIFLIYCNFPEFWYKSHSMNLNLISNYDHPHTLINEKYRDFSTYWKNPLSDHDLYYLLRSNSRDEEKLSLHTSHGYKIDHLLNKLLNLLKKCHSRYFTSNLKTAPHSRRDYKTSDDSLFQRSQRKKTWQITTNPEGTTSNDTIVDMTSQKISSDTMKPNNIYKICAIHHLLFHASCHRLIILFTFIPLI